MDAFTKEGVVPAVIDSVPPKELSVKFGDITLTPGAVLTPTQVKDKPTVSYEAGAGAMYTLVLSDPDAPSRTNQEFGEFLHWLVANIPGNTIGKGDELCEYVGSGPGKGSGLHRYTYLLYKQTAPIQFEKIKNTDRFPRRKWKAREFAKANKLEGPLAGNFYQAEWDEWVPNIHKQLGIA